MTLRPITIQDAAYAAGFFDGEGCISIALQLGSTARGKHYPNTRRYFLSVTMSQNDPAPLRWLVERFGGSTRFLRGKRTYDKGYYERWNWCVTTKGALNFLKMIRPFLIVKASQADIAFEFSETIVMNRRKTPPDVQALRTDMYLRMKEAKHAFKIASAK